MAAARFVLGALFIVAPLVAVGWGSRLAESGSLRERRRRGLAWALASALGTWVLLIAFAGAAFSSTGTTNAPVSLALIVKAAGPFAGGALLLLLCMYAALGVWLRLWRD